MTRCQSSAVAVVKLVKAMGRLSNYDFPQDSELRLLRHPRENGDPGRAASCSSWGHNDMRKLILAGILAGVLAAPALPAWAAEPFNITGSWVPIYHAAAW